MLNSQTQKVLLDLTTIGNFAVFEENHIVITQKEKTVIAFIFSDKLGEDPFQPMGIFYLKEFLSLVSFFGEDADISINEHGLITIKKDNAKQEYETESIAKMEAFKVPVKVIDNIESSPVSFSFSISNEDLDKYKKISGTLGSNKLIVDFQTDDYKIISTKISANGNYINPSEFVIDGEASESGKIVFDFMNIAALPNWDYEVTVHKNQKTGNYITLWKSIDYPVKIVVAVSHE